MLQGSESPTTGQGRRADSKTSFRGLTQQSRRYSSSPSVASIAENRARELAAIDWRYREARKQRHSAMPPIIWLRLAELELIIHHRWHGAIPATSAGQVFVRIAVNHLVGFSKNWRRRLDTWCDKFAPWLDEDVLDEIVDLAAANPTHYKADKLARILEIDIATRDLLRLTTIGAYDFDAKARAKRRLAVNAARKRKKRAERGAKLRAERVSQQRPWLTEGISRRTWYRRQKEMKS